VRRCSWTGQKNLQEWPPAQNDNFFAKICDGFKSPWDDSLQQFTSKSKCKISQLLYACGKKFSDSTF
jgi:hypothetical protein